MASDTPLTADEAHVTLSGLQQELNRLQRAIRLAIQGQLQKLTGQSMGTLAENRELVRSIHELLDSHGLRTRCCECGHPAILRASPRNGSKTGVFVFDHTIEGKRTFHGGRSVLPEMLLVAKPVRQSKKSRAS